MDPVVPPPPWIPEDDLLLKNSIEAGASLESLAKGAVQFSRRYSLAELRDRWWSLLYDPDVSAQASAAMAELELANSGGGSGIKEGGRKRKAQSIRKQYNTLRKRLCKQVFDSLDLALRDEMSLENHRIGFHGEEIGLVDVIRSGEVKDVSNLHVNNLVGYGSYTGLGGIGVGLSHSMNDVPLWKTIEDVPVPAMLVQVSAENKSDESEARGKYVNCVLNAPGVVLGDDGTHVSDSLSLLDLTNGDGLLFVDIDGKGTGDKPCYDNVDSLLVNSPCDIQGNDASDVRESQKLSMEAKPGMHSGLSATGLEAVANPSGSGCDDLNLISDPGNDVKSSAAGQSPQSEVSVELMICTFNTEDPHVPCNDGSDESIEVPDSVTLKSQQIVKDVGHSDSSINSQRKNEQDGSLKKVDTVSGSLAASQMVPLGPMLCKNSSDPLVVPKTENPGSNSISAVSGQSNSVIVNINPSYSRLVHATMMPALFGNSNQQEIDSMTSAEVNAHSKEQELLALPEPEEKSSSLDQEGGNDDDDNENYTDEEIPYFSDAETMILEMDLCPTDQDTGPNREVLRCQHAESKRTIMRLEQSAQSCMQRAIASQGAFAVLYGHTLKQYIKTSKVILGRATDGFQVDIDLGREGPANRISRRQALIMLEANGSFNIVNLGKTSIFLNGKTVVPGQQRGLCTSSLIQIRDMSFIFEVNDKCVSKFLENLNGEGETPKENI